MWFRVQYQLWLDCSEEECRFALWKINSASTKTVVSQRNFDSFELFLDFWDKEIVLPRVAKVSVYASISPSTIFTKKIRVPSSLSDEEVVEYIKLEQAILFPQCSEKIYFDFKCLSSSNDEKTLQIYVVDAQEINFLLEGFLARKLHIEVLTNEHFLPEGLLRKVVSVNSGCINLMPWRCRQRHRLKARVRLLALLFLVLSVVCLVLIGGMLHARNQRLVVQSDLLDKRSEQQKNSFFKLQNRQKKFYTLQKNYHNYQKQLQRFHKTICVLIFADTSRPEGLLLTQIASENGRILLSGRASSVLSLNRYAKLVESHCDIRKVQISRLQQEKESTDSVSDDSLLRLFELQVVL